MILVALLVGDSMPQHFGQGSMCMTTVRSPFDSSTKSVCDPLPYSFSPQVHRTETSVLNVGSIIAILSIVYEGNARNHSSMRKPQQHRTRAHRPDYDLQGSCPSEESHASSCRQQQRTAHTSPSNIHCPIDYTRQDSRGAHHAGQASEYTFYAQSRSSAHRRTLRAKISSYAAPGSAP